MAKVRIDKYDGGQYVTIFCPACQRLHTINNSPNGWGFNGDINYPTFDGSIGFHGEENGGYYCHSGVNNGRITYYSDSQHTFVNQTIDLPEIE